MRLASKYARKTDAVANGGRSCYRHAKSVTFRSGSEIPSDAVQNVSELEELNCQCRFVHA